MAGYWSKLFGGWTRRRRVNKAIRNLKRATDRQMHDALTEAAEGMEDGSSEFAESAVESVVSAIVDRKTGDYDGVKKNLADAKDDISTAEHLKKYAKDCKDAAKSYPA